VGVVTGDSVQPLSSFSLVSLCKVQLKLLSHFKNQ
jgi:hypothetical protein